MRVFMALYFFAVSLSFSASSEAADSFAIIVDATEGVLRDNGSPYVIYVGKRSDPVLCDLDVLKNAPISQLPNRDEILKSCTDKRFIEGKGAKVYALAFYSPSYFEKVPEISINEEKRKSKIGEDVTVLIRKLIDISVPFSGEADSVSRVEKMHTIANERAKINVVFSYALEDSENVTQIKATILSGPKEHWFLSLDLPVNKGDELKFDEANNQLVEKDTPSLFYLSANYMMGDILSDNNPVISKIAVKFSIKASSKPLDSYGIGLGYRFNELSLGSRKLGSVSVFVGSYWDTEDKIENGVVLEDASYSQNWKAGISFGLDKLSGWLN